MKTLWLGLVIVACAIAESGCGVPCDPSDRVISNGERWTAGASRVYRTSGPEGPFLPFEGATVIHLRHGLGVVPHRYQIQLAFTERPLQAGGGGSSFPAGNQVILQRVDAEEATFRNDSCANYFIQITLEGNVVSDAGVSD